jgi:hypothetical protein
MLYEVSWTIDVGAKTPEEAAEIAWEILHDPDSTATFLKVTNDKGEYMYDMEES